MEHEIDTIIKVLLIIFMILFIVYLIFKDLGIFSQTLGLEHLRVERGIKGLMSEIFSRHSEINEKKLLGTSDTEPESHEKLLIYQKPSRGNGRKNVFSF